MATMTPLTLAQLGIVDETDAAAQCVVSGIAADSRRVQAGDLFVARDGVAHRGVDFLADAIAKGAAAAVVDAEHGVDLNEFPVPVIAIADLAARTGEWASQLLGHPSQHLKVIGITGTNGKTSCAHYLAQGLEAIGFRTALIGTVGNGFLNALMPATHTTPDVITLHSLLADFLEQGAKAVVMEVSSHALDQARVAGVQFYAAALTNLTRDHLDYHGTMDAYGDAKRKLFTQYQPHHIALNLDDSFGRSVATDVAQQGQTFVGCSETDARASVYVAKADFSLQGTALELVTPLGQVAVSVPVIGGFNVANLMLVTGVLAGFPIDANQLAMALSAMTAVPGRMECIFVADRPAVVVDYAHTPDALEKALLAVRRHTQGQLWVVFGCGGDRDTSKRPEMAAVAERLADLLVVTSDNPRTESPELIIDGVLAGLKQPEAAVREVDRKAAITYAIKHAKPADLVLVAGKGHEDYQDIQGVKHPFSDQRVARELLDGGVLA